VEKWKSGKVENNIYIFYKWHIVVEKGNLGKKVVVKRDEVIKEKET
jgi:hypothetical protein